VSNFRASGIPERRHTEPVPADRRVHVLADGRWVDPNVIDPTGRYNVYDCPSGHHLLSMDLDRGVTPAFVACPDCDATAGSRFYRVPDPASSLPLRMVWRLATRSERKRERREGGDHYALGGLSREWVP